MDKTNLKAVIEAMLFVSTIPLSPADLKKLIKVQPEEFPVSPEAALVPPTSETELDAASQLAEMSESLESEISIQDIKATLVELVETSKQASHGFELVEVAGGYQYRTKVALAPYVKNLYQMPKQRLSVPSMETLAIVAYQQPVARLKIEEVRGVDSGGVLKTLLDRDLVRIVGRSEEPGRPILYGTTPFFLETFSLNALKDLPTLKDLEALEGTPGPMSEITPIEEEGEVLVEEESETGYFYSDGESNELIEDLENSLRGLKDLERKIFPEQKEQKEESVASSPEVTSPSERNSP